MAKRYDSTTRKLLAFDPPAWLACAGLTPTGPVRVIDSDVSTITAEADAVFAVGDPVDYLVHFELQTSRDVLLPRRLLRYNVLLHYKHEVPVRSVAVLLRPEADGPEVTDIHEVRHHEGDTYIDFRYATVRVWELDLEAVLRGGLGTLPLAPLLDAALASPEPVIRRIKKRLNLEVGKPSANELWAAVNILLGLRYDDELADQLLRGVLEMEDSTTYQAIIRKGRAEGRAEALAEGRAEVERVSKALIRRMILSLGRHRFGAAQAMTVAALEAIQDGERLMRIEENLLDATTWDDLLATP